MMNRIKTAVEQQIAKQQEAAERAVQAAFNKPHLVQMRQRMEQ